MDSSRNPRGIHRLSTDSYTVCTTARILGTNVGMNCGCCVDNKTCPQAAPIHPRVIPRQSTGGHAVRTGEIAEIHSFHRAYYYPCSSSRKFLLKTGCVDKSRTHRTKRRGPGTTQGRADADFADTRRVRRSLHAARDRRGLKGTRVRGQSCTDRSPRGRSARAHHAPRPSPSAVGRPHAPELFTAFFRDTCGRTLASPIRGLPTDRHRTPASYPGPLCGLVRRRCDDVSSTRRGGRSGAAKRGTVLGRSLCQNSSAVGRRRGRRNIAVRRNRRGGICGGSTATDPH